MKMDSRLARGFAVALIGAAALGVSPANAQQSEALLHEQLIDGVRGLFGKLFGGDNAAPQQPAAASPPPVAQPAAASTVAPQRRTEEVSVAVAAPSAQVAGRSLHEA